jgi:hypothetical protein
MQRDVEVVRQEVRSTVEWLRAHYPGLEDDEQTWIDTLEGETDIKEVAAKLIERAIECSTMTDALKIRADAIAARKKRLDDQEKSIRGAVVILLQEAALRKLELPEATLSLRDLKPKLVVADLAALPDDCCKFERKADMDALKAAVEAHDAARIERINAGENVNDFGTGIAGVEWSAGGVSLTVRTK